MAWSHGELKIHQGAIIRTSWRKERKKEEKEREWGLRKRRTVEENEQRGGERERGWKGKGSGKYCIAPIF